MSNVTLEQKTIGKRMVERAMGFKRALSLLSLPSSVEMFLDICQITYKILTVREIT